VVGVPVRRGIAFRGWRDRAPRPGSPAWNGGMRELHEYRNAAALQANLDYRGRSGSKLVECLLERCVEQFLEAAVEIARRRSSWPHVAGVAERNSPSGEKATCTSKGLPDSSAPDER